MSICAAVTGDRSGLEAPGVGAGQRATDRLWLIEVAGRASDSWFRVHDHAQRAIGDDMRGTLAGILLALSWSPEARGELDIDTLTRVHRLLAIPATAPLMLALADVPAS